MSTTVLLVRHASHSVVDRVLVGRTPGVRLSQAGWREASQVASGVAARFAGGPVAVVQSSPRRRARETAAPIAAALGAEVEIVPALDEIDFGQWTGCRFDDLAGDPRWQAWNAARGSGRPPAGESMVEAQARIVDHIERLGRTLGGARAVLVSHCDVIKAALLHVLGRPVDAWGDIEVAPASTSIIEIAMGRARVVAVNEPAGVGEWSAS